MDSELQTLQRAFTEAIQQLQDLQERFVSGSPSVVTAKLSDALQQQLTVIAGLNDDMEKAIQNEPPPGSGEDGDVAEEKSGAMVDVTPLAKRLKPVLDNMHGGHDEHVRQISDGGVLHEDKSVRVPVRQRSRQTRSGRAEKHLTFLLPETPLDERFVQESDQVGGPVVRTPGEKGRLGVFSPGRDGQVFTPGVASTPIAVEVLSSLYSINNNQKVNINKHQAQKKESRKTGHTSVKTTSAKKAAEAALAAASRPRQKSQGNKTCNCKRSQCLKMYCDCFAASGYCLPGCACLNCKNTNENQGLVDSAREAILLKNPSAFDDKVNMEEGHRKGCRCKRSKCLKKYCECYNAGVKCNPNVCQCIGCHNGLDASDDVDDPPMESLAALELVHSKELLHEEEDATTRMKRSRKSNSASKPEDKTVTNAIFTPDALEFVTPNRINALVSNNSGNQISPAMIAALGPLAVLASQGQESQNQGAAPCVQDLPEGEMATSPTLRPASSALVSHLSTGDEDDTTATSPGFKMPVYKVAKPHTRRITNGLSVITDDVKENVIKAVSVEDMTAKRPRRAASGGVSGAIAAARADWGLDHISPPLKHQFTSQQGENNIAASKERSALLRKALQNENGAVHHVDETDAASVLVSMNSMG